MGHDSRLVGLIKMQIILIITFIRTEYLLGRPAASQRAKFDDMGSLMSVGFLMYLFINDFLP